MQLVSLLVDTRPVLAFREGERYFDLSSSDPSLGTDVGMLLASGEDWKQRVASAVSSARELPGEGIRFRPLLPAPSKFLCLGLNDYKHAAEANLPVPEVPEVFMRVASSLIGHEEPRLRPPESHMLDYEVELAVVIGREGRRIPVDKALDYVAGYTVFNDGSIRDIQVRTNQWTLGKNFHGTGALGPALVTPDELPEGAKGLSMETYVGDERLQHGNTGDMVFDVAHTLALLSEAMVLVPGDVIAMGTPSGIGFARKPQRFLLPGETCRVVIEKIGTLQNTVIDETVSR